MDINRCEIISEVEFGSTFQGTSDEYSDVDLMRLVVQPLEDVVFRNNQKASHHTDEARYYSVERFISLTFKGSFDNVLLLCAQLVQTKDTNFYKKVLVPLENVFEPYLKSNFKTLTLSLIGQMNKVIRNKEEINGKELLKFTNFHLHLIRLLKFAEGKEKITYENFANLDNETIKDRIKYKRYSFKELNQDGLFYELTGWNTLKELQDWYDDWSSNIVDLIHDLDKFEADKEFMKNIESYVKRMCIEYILGDEKEYDFRKFE